MPRVSGKPLRKECESCQQQIPVACKTCPECSHELIPEKDKDREPTNFQLSPDVTEGDGDQGERRRSVRAKRDKPDYYDALDYDSKRQKGPRTPGERTPGAQKRGSFSGRGSLGSAQGPKARRAIGYSSYNPGPTRATLSWRKGGPVDEEDLVKKKGKKPNGSKREECEEAVELYLEVGYILSYLGFVVILNLFCRRSRRRRSLCAL